MVYEITPFDVAWYVLRVTYSRELKLKEYLDSQSIENFIPMHYVMDTKGTKKKRKLVPVIHNLIFVHTAKRKIDVIKQDVNLGRIVRYMMDKLNDRPVIVPEKQMQDFITVAGSYDEQILYLTPAEVGMKKGDKVRITSGIWTGVEGDFIRIGGDRRVVISIPGLMAVATAFVHPSCIERCEKRNTSVLN
jgi:transcription antitermination factor NusG